MAKSAKVWIVVGAVVGVVLIGLGFAVFVAPKGIGADASVVKSDPQANLTGAVMEVADVTEANLTEANVRDADLTGANLTRANLTNANLTRAVLVFATLTGANLTGANLTGAVRDDPDGGLTLDLPDPSLLG